jgi:hypothetical protein
MLKTLENVTAEPGKRYLCTTIHKSRRICRFGYHRKNNYKNWKKPPEGSFPKLIWVGWRDDKNGRFLRPEEVISYEEVVPKSQVPSDLDTTDLVSDHPAG